MSRRSPRQPGRPKIHRSYTVQEVTDLLGVHKNTVRNWLRNGLASLNERRPILILGRELAGYLAKRQKNRKRPCGLGQIYCLRCRRPHRPVSGTARYEPSDAGAGRVRGACPSCAATMYRRISDTGLERERTHFDLPLPSAQEHIAERQQSLVTCDFRRE